MILDRKFEVFFTTAEVGSFSQAAYRLSLSQSAVSFHINSLETELGVKLFNRRGRTISLTQEGEFLFDQGKKLVEHVERLKSLLSVDSEKITKRIRMGSDTPTCVYILPSVISEYSKREPGVIFSYRHLHRYELVERLLAKELDIAMVGVAMRHKKLSSFPCFNDEIVLVGPASSERKTITLSRLKSEPLVLVGNDEGLELLLRRELARKGAPLKEMNIFVEVDDLALAKNFVQAGLGYTFLPRVTIRNELDCGLLKEVRVRGLNLKRQTYIIIPRESPSKKVVADFLDFMAGK